MSLKAFHIFFIIISALLSMVLIGWGLRSQTFWLVGVGAGTLVLLFPYGIWFSRKMKKLSTISLFVVSSLSGLLTSQVSWACAVCFGDPTSKMSQSLQSGILFLGITIFALLGAILIIALSWRKRARLLEK